MDQIRLRNDPRTTRETDSAAIPPGSVRGGKLVLVTQVQIPAVRVVSMPSAESGHPARGRQRIDLRSQQTEHVKGPTESGSLSSSRNLHSIQGKHRDRIAASYHIRPM